MCRDLALMAVRPVGGSGAGVVSAFDSQVGMGTVRTADGTELGFHCTQIGDGSRAIDVGAAVTFSVIAGHHGCWEAGQLALA